jgi:predicted component of type VI protein secretion system
MAMTCARCGGSLAESGAPCPTCVPEAGATEWLERGDGTRFPLLGSTVTLGRGSGNDWVLADTSISRRHARLQRLPNGWLLIDLHSSNGTWVNDERVVVPYLLEDGDRVRIGDETLLFRVAAGPGAARPPTVLGRAAFDVPGSEIKPAPGDRPPA